MIKIFSLITILFLQQWCSAQYNRSDIISIAVTGPEVFKTYGFNDSSQITLHGGLLKVEYSRLFTVVKKLKIGPTFSFQRGFTRISLSTEGYSKDAFINSDYSALGFGINAFYPFLQIDDKRSLQANFGLLITKPDIKELILAQLFYPAGVVSYQNAVQILHRDDTR